MLLLVIDTSGKDGCVGLVRAGEVDRPANVEVIEEVPLAGGTFSAQLIPQISGLLEQRGFRKSDVQAFLVVCGPGSFTGLRVGLAAIKALAEILQKPIVPLSLLEVLAPYSYSIAAANDAAPGTLFRYAVALDAGRGEAYVGDYEITFTSDGKDFPKGLSESLLALDKLAGLLETGGIQWIATPDPLIFDGLTSRVDESRRHCIRRNLRRPRSAEIGMVGLKKLNAGETVSPEGLEANYIRRTDAEIFAKPATSR